MKQAKSSKEHTEVNLKIMPDIGNIAAKHLNKFPTAESCFTDDFSLLKWENIQSLFMKLTIGVRK